MPEKITTDLCRQSTLGQQLFDDFVSKRINTNTINFGSPMKRCQLQTWKSTGKRTKLSLGEKVAELKDHRTLFARLLVVSRSRPDINKQWESMNFQLYHGQCLLLMVKCCIDTHEPSSDTAMETESEGAFRVSLIDGMAEVQSMGKPDWVKNCSQLADHFTSRVLEKHGQMDEVRVIFDRYDVEHSLKQATRDRRQATQAPVAYHITDTTNISKVPLKRLLSHTTTKMELTAYLAEKMLERALAVAQHMVVAWGTQCMATHADKQYLNSDHEEADTKLILHAADASACGATSISIYSPDTDVLILAVRRYPELCKNMQFVTGTGRNHWIIQLGPIYEALGKVKAAALPGLHALSGCDNTGSFAGKGKLSFWKAFQEANENVLNALAYLGTAPALSDDTFMAIEQFVCSVYLPKTQIAEVKNLRWWLFRKKQAESERLPPTPDALRQSRAPNTKP